MRKIIKKFSEVRGFLAGYFLSKSIKRFYITFEDDPDFKEVKEAIENLINTIEKWENKE